MSLGDEGKLDEAIAAFDACANIEELRTSLQRIVVEEGFLSFAFVDTSLPGQSDPLVIATNPESWDREYRSNGFVHVDPMIPASRRTNTPFHWLSVGMPPQQGVRKPGALKTMEAARDHGFENGLVIPFHYVDPLGRMCWSVCTFFWRDKLKEFWPVFRRKRLFLHIVLLYWAQRAVDIASRDRRLPARFLDPDGNPLVQVHLTDREKDVLSWAARGKTGVETAEILGVSKDTVETHTRHAIQKLGAINKTHAVVTALHLRAIDI